MIVATVASKLAGLIEARANCERSGNAEWLNRWSEQIQELARERLPSGAGIDTGTHVRLESSTAERIVLGFSFHHMNESGMYDGWTEHAAVITPSFHGIRVAITGPDRNGVKEYLADTFHMALSAEI